MFFMIEEAKETILDFSKGTESTMILFCFSVNIKWINLTR